MQPEVKNEANQYLHKHTHVHVQKNRTYKATTENLAVPTNFVPITRFTIAEQAL